MTVATVPSTRPELSADGVREFLQAAGVDLSKPALLGRRGYYRDTMGRAGQNDINMYDDAIFYLSKSAFRSFNANTDPSKDHPHVAQLAPGVWSYKLGIHGLMRPLWLRYKALIQAGEVKVMRESARPSDPRRPDVGWFGINIHRGSLVSTSSEGCQTIHPSQWDEFIGLVESDLKKYDTLKIPFVLTEREAATS